jgi:hypothetical protein
LYNKLIWSIDLEDAFQTGVRIYLDFFHQLIQSNLMQALSLDAAGQIAVNIVLEHSTTQVLRQLAIDRQLTPERRNREPAQIDDTGSIVAGTQTYDPYTFRPVIERHLNHISNTMESTRIGPSQTQAKLIPHSINIQAVENASLREHMSNEHTLMSAPLTQNISEYSWINNLELSKNVSQDVPPSWEDSSWEGFQVYTP